MSRTRSPRSGNDVDRYRRLSLGEARAAHPYLAFLGLPAQETAAVLRKLETGLPFSAFERLRRTFGLAATELSAVVGIPPRTLADPTGSCHNRGVSDSPGLPGTPVGMPAEFPIHRFAPVAASNLPDGQRAS